MVKLTLPFRLAEQVHGTMSQRALSTIDLSPGPWSTMVEEIRDRHPSLYERALTSSGRVAAGFALVLNDEVMHGGLQDLNLRSGDELYLIATIAGGCSV